MCSSSLALLLAMAAWRTSAFITVPGHRPRPSVRRRMTNDPGYDAPPDDSTSVHDLESALSFLQKDSTFVSSVMSSQLSEGASRPSLTEPEAVAESLLATRLSLQLDRCEVGRSRVTGPDAGDGLFATRDIQPGEIVTCYPGDALVYSPDEGEEGDQGILWGAHVPTELRDEERLVTELLDFAMGWPLEATGYVVGVPELRGDSAYAGHFANDGAILLPGGKVEAYEEATTALCNARHEDCGGSHIVTMATRLIPCGEEVLVTYGATYWLEREERRRAWEQEDAAYDAAYDAAAGAGAGAGTGGVAAGEGRGPEGGRWAADDFEIFPTDSVSVLPREGAWEDRPRTTPPDGSPGAAAALSSVSGPRGALDGDMHDMQEDDGDADAEADQSFDFSVEDDDEGDSDWEPNGAETSL